MATTSRVAVMEGTLGEVSLADLLQVISIGRQYTAIELRQDDESPAATLFLKSGKLISAAAEGTRGKEAFLRLFPMPEATTFQVFRTETPSSMPEPIGPIGMLLLEALDRSINSGRSSATAPKPNDRGQSARPRSVASPGSTSNPPSIASARPAPVTPIRSSTMRPDGQVQSKPPAAAPAQQPEAVRVSQARSVVGHVSQPSLYPRDTSMRKASERGVPPFVLAVASPKGGSGKTTLALNLAVTLARQDHGVILVDADINGDVLSAIDSRDRSRAGTFDVLGGRAPIEDALLSTVMPHFKIMPAMGPTITDVGLGMPEQGDRWRELLSHLKSKTDFVIVDSPSGMFGVTQHILRSATHVMGVLQAEVLAQRSFVMFGQALDALPSHSRPRVLGVLLNMVQPALPASVSVLQRACSGLPREWLFETSIPRSAAFLEASEIGLPLRLLDDRNPPAVSWLFEMLASEVIDRLRLSAPERKIQSLLV